MPIPDYQTCMLPLLRIAEDGKEHRVVDAVNIIADQYNLSPEERQELLPSGKQLIISNRVGWARTYLKQAGLLRDPKRSYFQITDRGREVLKKNPKEVNRKSLEQFKEFRDFQTKTRTSTQKVDESSDDAVSSVTPDEALDEGYQKLIADLADQVLERILSCTPSFFERLVVELLVKMGYGGSLKEAAHIVGKSGDGGIDGIINEDKLGLDVIYIQAKRWEGVVGRPEIQKFAGALLGKKARRGIFITTSSFTRDATDYVENLETKIILINGERLADLMIEYNLGVSVRQTYEIKQVDSDYFSEEV